MKAVTFITCECGAQVAPITMDVPDNEAYEFQGICPVCLRELQLGIAARTNEVPANLDGLDAAP